eukprot:570081-Rhodomonas_salina.1
MKLRLCGRCPVDWRTNHQRMPPLDTLQYQSSTETTQQLMTHPSTSIRQPVTALIAISKHTYRDLSQVRCDSLSTLPAHTRTQRHRHRDTDRDIQTETYRQRHTDTHTDRITVPCQTFALAALDEGVRQPRLALGQHPVLAAF